MKREGYNSGRVRKIRDILLLLLLLTLPGCGYIFMTEPYYPPGMPRQFQADYDRVWNAVLEALDEQGYVIAQMSKADGYITTDRKEWLHYRSKLSVRFVSENDAIKVTINEYSQKLEGLTTERPYWVDGSPSGGYQQWILDDVGKRLGIKRERK